MSLVEIVWSNFEFRSYTSDYRCCGLIKNEATHNSGSRDKTHLLGGLPTILQDRYGGKVSVKIEISKTAG